MKVKLVSQPFLTNGSGLIHKKMFLQNKKIRFSAKLCEMRKMLTSKIVHLKQIFKFYLDNFFGKTYGFYFNKKNVVKNKKFLFLPFFDKTRGFCFNREKYYLKSKIQFSGQTL